MLVFQKIPVFISRVTSRVTFNIRGGKDKEDIILKKPLNYF